MSFSGASVFFFTPYRADGTPMPASVMKFDSKECASSPKRSGKEEVLFLGKRWLRMRPALEKVARFLIQKDG